MQETLTINEKFGKLSSVKNLHDKVKMKATDWEKVFAIYRTKNPYQEEKF